MPPRSWSKASRRNGLNEIVARAPLTLALSAALCLATLALLWLGYRTTVAQQRGERLLADRRANETLALLIAALDRDMKGAQLAVLVPFNQEQLLGGGPSDMAALASRSFARFPYPETFFVWRGRSPRDEGTYVFNRADRLPSWDTTVATGVPYPVVTHRGETPLTAVIDRIRGDAGHRKRFAAYELAIGGQPYQVVVHLLHDDVTGPGGLVGLIGYTVNLEWAKREYFKEIVGQISRIGGEDKDIAISILDNSGAAIASTASNVADVPTSIRHFPLRFFDRSLTKMLPETLEPQQWTARVTSAQGSAQSGALNARRMLSLMGLAALASIIGVVVIARGLFVTSAVIAIKSEFVSTVTHELKTPLSLMRLVAESLVTGRYRGVEKIPEYGMLLSAEVTRMTHLIENLLSYARLDGISGGYAMTPVDVVELLEEASAICRPRLTQLGCRLNIEIGADPIVLLGDRTELLHALNNLLDNSIKYSEAISGSVITLRGHRSNAAVVIEVEDRGVGIDADDLPLVFEKFYRGRNARVGGSGLGLAIVNRIVTNHGGSVDIRSTVRRGTTVVVTLPAA
jgi:signal transduction histidine kinase